MCVVLMAGKTSEVGSVSSVSELLGGIMYVKDQRGERAKASTLTKASCRLAAESGVAAQTSQCRVQLQRAGSSSIQ